MRLSRPLLTYYCVGQAVFKQAQRVKARFSVRQLPDGSIVGSLALLKPKSETALSMFSKELGHFRLEGKEKKHGFILNVKRCYLTRRTLRPTTIGGEFVASSALAIHSLMTRRLERPAFVEAAVTNMYRTFRVIVDGPLGKMQIAHDKAIEEMEQLMRHQQISLVTSYIQILADKAVGMSVKQLMKSAQDAVEGLLNITRLSQTCWHDCCSLSIYERDEEGTGELLAIRMQVPRRRPPVSLGITNPAHSDIFIQTAYKGYGKELEARHGFETALHWYIESNAAGVAESRYLTACTCLELLTGRLAKHSRRQFVLRKPNFEELYSALKDKLIFWIRSARVPVEKQRQLEQSLRGINRPSFKSKIKALLKEWRIKFDDVDLDLQQIINIRNQITHTGTSQSRGLVKEYVKLYVVLTRVFLSMLHYEGEYYDWFHSKWMKMTDVSTS